MTPDLNDNTCFLGKLKVILISLSKIGELRSTLGNIAVTEEKTRYSNGRLLETVCLAKGVSLESVLAESVCSLFVLYPCHRIGRIWQVSAQRT